MKFNKLLLVLFAFVMTNSFAHAYLISDQGTTVKNLSGSLLDRGNLTIEIYDLPTGGNLVFSSIIENAIVNGSWNLMINPVLEYGKSYWKDYEINGEDLDFDGNDRIEFQSSIGYINNFSFVNLSLINSCPVGSSIRLVYSNGSVICESSSSIIANLSDYALRNQSETFFGNVTTSYTGFFRFLGSLVNRITKLFVVDVDVSGNVNVSGNVSAYYFKGDGSLLANLSVAQESDPIFVVENSTLWNAINSKLAQSDQRYNETTLILSVNSTTNVMSLGFYNSTEVNNLISGVGWANSSFNQSLTDSLYYSIANPLNFVNYTQASIYNDTSLILTTNSSLWSYVNSSESDWVTTFNSTYNNLLGKQCSTGFFVNGTLSNGTLICAQPVLSESDPLWTANSTFILYISNLPLENRTINHITNITGFSFNYNQTTPSITYINSQGYLTSSMGNATYLLATESLSNRSLVHCSNITGASSNLCTINNNFGNIFNQILNTTSNVTFNNITVVDEIIINGVRVKQWLYNQSDGSYNSTYSIFAYNQTNAVFLMQLLNNTIANYGNIVGFNSTYNITYALWAYNQTITSNPFNQVLNITSNVTFSNLTVNSNSVFVNNLSASTGFFSFLGSALSRISRIFVVDVDVLNNLSVAGNISSRYYFGSLNTSTFPTSSCSGTDKVTGIRANGTVSCATDQTSGGGIIYYKNATNSVIQMTSSDTFYEAVCLSLPLGTYLINANIQFGRDATTAQFITGRIANETTTFVAGTQYHPSVNGVRMNLALTTVEIFSSTTTVCLQGATNAGNANSRMYPDSGRSLDSTSGTGTVINAVKIG